ncbi:hypothetical protein SAMN06269185_1798 [Natronoarchaeum philippinense]|uniref:Integral membrane protein n=1 Tax=Natronoarchaeum philippinense TaxID=558529 RepID=A0A285NUE9_NATPI|nr:DUF2391 domain-containing protein [Natronoarchaeum philippinense]SNZ12543.1 hypothetical protein SAMN06269185_1798 [Natronoarchaeum philippinense]
MKLGRLRHPEFRLADAAQQSVGGILLAGPFVVTEEVWSLASNMDGLQTLLVIALTASIGYAALYQADTGRDPDSEIEVAGVPIRFVSLMLVAFGSVALLAMILDAPDTFVAAYPNGSMTEAIWVSFKAVAVGSVFSVVGAATADSVF